VLNCVLQVQRTRVHGLARSHASRQASRRVVPPSVVELGAGVGAYGRVLRHYANLYAGALRSRGARTVASAPRNDSSGAASNGVARAMEVAGAAVRWSGYDGAGNVEVVSGGLVRFADLSLPLAVPRAEWVPRLSLTHTDTVLPRHRHTHSARLCLPLR
jgi:hypothetical protein